MIWREGQLPPGSPTFAGGLPYELLSYAYSLLGMGLRLRENGGQQVIARQAFEYAAMSLESLLVKGGQADDARSFHYVIAAAAYHLGRFSARAFSLLLYGQRAASFSPIERCLGHLILRDLGALEQEIIAWRIDGPGTDENIAAALLEGWEARNDDETFPDSDDSSYVGDALGAAIIDTFLAGMGLFVSGLERGERAFIDQAIERLRTGLDACAEVHLLPQWWAYRLAVNIIDDLWSCSFHERLPLIPNDPDEVRWSELRHRFIALLFRRPRAEIDLWPSQLDAATQAVDADQDLVVSLPTSAGKTRIAELCILRCLAAEKRVVFITPLRALSAQTESTLQGTFIPLGFSISTLYGSIGTSSYDEHALGSRSIVVATPEKLDFALRNDPALLNDVGLIVLDEGHMIGLGEREVRYEMQIQRLLKRADAADRRMVCLSAILPGGEELEDFVAWLSQDGEGNLIKSRWRPTLLRFGEVIWANSRARLEVGVGDERPFIPTFLSARAAPQGGRQRPFPNNQRELVLATTWRLAEDGQSVLIYCPERRSVEPYARAIVQLHGYGLLPSMIGDAGAKIAIAVVIGTEWLGEDHPILECLRLGVAVHHGALPTPFRKEIERLLRERVLKITVSSPTLAQGLNLSATTVVLHGIIRNREPIDVAEFRNVVGRAGRAFVDTEGLVLFPFYQPHAQRRRQWEALKSADAGREMESGLLTLVVTLLQRMRLQLGVSYEQLSEYVLNNAQAWDFPQLASELEQVSLDERRQWQAHLATLDTAILSLMGEQDVPDNEIAERLDQVLSSSLWERRLNRRTEELRRVYTSALHGRAKVLWSNSNTNQRRAYFLAGVGLETGRQLDDVAAAANSLLVDANFYISTGDNEAAIRAFISLGDLIFAIPPFVPNPLPDNWHDILRAWLSGQAMAELAEDAEDVLRFVEDGLIYKLPWGMEALRVRSLAIGDAIAEGTTMADYEMAFAVPAMETGTLNRSAALLMQAGFNSRLAAIKAVTDTAATFESNNGLRDWLASEEVVTLTSQPNWPTEHTAGIWREFLASFAPPERAHWSDWTYSDQVNWESEEHRPNVGDVVRIVHSTRADRWLVLTPDHGLLGTLAHPLNLSRKGLVRAIVGANRASVDMEYIGPADLAPAQVG
jgi:superfamily II DNA/RNA helicase